MPVQTITWENNKVKIIDQTQLPLKLIYLEIEDYHDLCEAIQSLRVRGAPAIGIAGAYGVVLGLNEFESENKQEFFAQAEKIISDLASTRPTAINLFWALDRMKRILIRHREAPIVQIKQALLAQALQILEEDKIICRKMGNWGASLVEDNTTILTHCNAGGLATADYGTALGVLYAAKEQGKNISVYADETRPLLQGARLTTWELMQSQIDVTLICDNMAAFVMQQGRIDYIFVGADRIASNGDVANKIGTYNLAVLAQFHQIPFYVVAPMSTLDFALDSGKQIPIEERSEDEVTSGFGARTAPYGVKVYSPAFDITPNNLVTAIITEKGIAYPPFLENLKKFQNNT